jgi:hypothetical protein
MEQLSLFDEIQPAKKKKFESNSLGPKSNQIGYREYIQSPDWRKKRERAFELIGRKCTRCGSTQQLEVHHITYNNLYSESTYDVEILCKSCHEPADRQRELDTGFSTWLHNKYGDCAEGYNDEISWQKFNDWIDSESY